MFKPHSAKPFADTLRATREAASVAPTFDSALIDARECRALFLAVDRLATADETNGAIRRRAAAIRQARSVAILRDLVPEGVTVKSVATLAGYSWGDWSSSLKLGRALAEKGDPPSDCRTIGDLKRWSEGKPYGPRVPLTDEEKKARKAKSEEKKAAQRESIRQELIKEMGGEGAVPIKFVDALKLAPLRAIAEAMTDRLRAAKSPEVSDALSALEDLSDTLSVVLVDNMVRTAPEVFTGTDGQ